MCGSWCPSPNDALRSTRCHQGQCPDKRWDATSRDPPGGRAEACRPQNTCGNSARPELARPLQRCSLSRTGAGLHSGWCSWHFLCRLLDCGPDALIRSTAADVPRHGLVNLLVRWLFIGLQECSSLHDLADLAVPALRHIDLHPRFLKGMQTVLVKTFDRGNFLRRRVAHTGYARSRRLSVDVNRTGATKPDATAKF